MPKSKSVLKRVQIDGKVLFLPNVNLKKKKKKKKLSTAVRNSTVSTSLGALQKKNSKKKKLK